MARIKFTANFYGDGDRRTASVEATIVEMVPLKASSSTGDPVALRVRATMTDADISQVTGGGWTDAVVTDGGRTVAGKVSQLEVQDAGEVEFLLTPGD